MSSSIACGWLHLCSSATWASFLLRASALVLLRIVIAATTAQSTDRAGWRMTCQVGQVV
jgi:hypothetical protein